MADYSTNNGFDGMWLVAAAAGVAVLLTVLVVSVGTGPQPQGALPQIGATPQTRASIQGSAPPTAGN